MKAKFIYENIKFKRGISPKEALGLGNFTSKIFYNLKNRNKYKNLKLKFDGDNITIRGSKVPLIYNNNEGHSIETPINIYQDIKILKDSTGGIFGGEIYANIISRIISNIINTRVEEFDGSDPYIHETSVDSLASIIESNLKSAEESFIEELNDSEDDEYENEKEW